MSNNSTPALLPNRDDSKTLPILEDIIIQQHKKQNEDKELPTVVKDIGANEYKAYGEIGTAQALQAEACRIIPRVEMNPVLLKSGGRRESDGAYLCSVLVLGKQIAREDYGQLGSRMDSLLSLVLSAHKDLAVTTNSRVIVIEGAGSCTELNLMERDIVNLPLVRKLKCPWLLVANIDCGGVFAQIVGTKACLPESDWNMCVGVIVNKLRGEAKYFEPGPKMLEEMVGKPIFVVPYLYDLNLPEEDGLGIERRLSKEYSYDEREKDNNNLKTNENVTKKPSIVVVAYPHMSIADDICPLESDPNYDVQWRRHCIPLPFPSTDTVILPGSRLTRSDLKWLTQDTEWGAFLKTHVAAGGSILGLCGGYQMLGIYVEDKDGIEGLSGITDGLNLLPTTTKILSVDNKVVTPKSATLHSHHHDITKNDTVVHGFELHCGKTEVADISTSTCTTGYKDDDLKSLLTMDDGTKEGLCLGNVRGTYLHGILRTPEARKLLLTSHMTTSSCFTEDNINLEHVDPLDRLASHLETCGLTYGVLSQMIGKTGNETN